MSRRRAPREKLQQLQDGIVQQRVGGAGRVFNAAPVESQSTAVSRALASVANISEKAWQDDQFTLTASGAQTVTLTYLPVDNSEDVKLNGIGAERGDEWTRSSQTLSLLTALDAQTSDLLTVHYEYLTGVPALATGLTLYEGSYFTAAGGLEGPTASRVVSDTAGAGWLRLTNATNSAIGGVYGNEVFPSGQAISVEFDYAAYGGDRADGICLYLLDGDQTPPTGGGTGGNLGYVGLAGGFLGIGLDGDWGQFSNLLSGGPGAQPHRVVLGGPFSGGNDYITSASVSPETMDEHNRTDTVHVTVTITAALLVTVQLDFGSGDTTYINAYDVTAVCGTPPANYRIGLAGTTGNDNNIHEIRNFEATSGSFALAIPGTGTHS